MPLPWKKPKPGRISRFVTDLQQSPGSLVVETGFPTSLIDLFVKNRDRLKKSPSKHNNNNKAQTQSVPTRSRRVLSPPPPSISQKLDPTSVTEDLAASKSEDSVEKRDDGDNNNNKSPTQTVPTQRRVPSPPQNIDPPSVTEDLAASKIEESVENREDGDSDGGHGGDRGGGGGCCVLTVVAVKVFSVAVLALSTKRLAVGITLAAFSLLFLELAVARVFTLLNFRRDARVRLDSLIVESFEDSRNCSIKETTTFDKAEDREMQTIRDVVYTKEKTKGAKLKSKIVKKIVPKKFRSYKKQRKSKIKEKEVEDEGEESSVSEVSSLYSDEGDEIGSNPTSLLESCEEIEPEEESRKDPTKAIVMMVIALAGLLSGKVLAIGLTLSSCLILRFVCCKISN